jgi:hypothetical protein
MIGSPSLQRHLLLSTLATAPVKQLFEVVICRFVTLRGVKVGADRAQSDRGVGQVSIGLKIVFVVR